MRCSDLEAYSPPDYNPNFGSDWLPLVTDPAIREWAKDVNGLWAYLSRVVSLTTSVRSNPPACCCATPNVWLSSTQSTAHSLAACVSLFTLISACSLHRCWPILRQRSKCTWLHGAFKPAAAMQENASVAENPKQHSLLTLPNPGVVAGDRFREVYYWDTYWIVLGLLTSRMTETATVHPGCKR